MPEKKAKTGGSNNGVKLAIAGVAIVVAGGLLYWNLVASKPPVAIAEPPPVADAEAPPPVAPANQPPPLSGNRPTSLGR